MNATQLLTHFDRLAEAPDAVPRLRRFILDLAVRGKLVEQDAGDEPAAKLLKRIYEHKTALVRDGLLREQFAFTEVPLAIQPYRVKSNWMWAFFGSIMISRDGERIPVSKEERNTRAKTYDYYGASGVIDKIDCFLFDKALLLIGEDGANLINRSTPIAFIARGQYWVNNHAHVLDGITEDFLRYIELYVNAIDLKAYVTGTAQPKMNQAKMNSIPVAIPPEAEQHRIVAKVDELMALCDQLETAQQERERRRDFLAAASLQRLNQPAADTTPEAQRQYARFHLDHLPRLATRAEHIKAMRRTILNLAVRGLLVPQDGNDEPAKALLKSIREEKAQLARIGVIPKEKTADGKALLTFALPALWQAVRLGDVCNLVTSGSRGWAEFYAESGPKFLRAQNIRFGCLRLDELACVNPPAKSEGARTQVQQGDLLIVITGAGVTNPALLDRDLGVAYVSQHVALVRPSNTALSRWLLLCLMAGPGGRDELVERAYGAGKPGLNLDNIRSLNTPIPPLTEQHRIVAKVDELMALCDQLEAQLTTAQTDSRRLLEAVLEDALAPM